MTVDSAEVKKTSDGRWLTPAAFLEINSERDDSWADAGARTRSAKALEKFGGRHPIT